MEQVDITQSSQHPFIKGFRSKSVLKMLLLFFFFFKNKKILLSLGVAVTKIILIFTLMCLLSLFVL
jgi:hypothetical protein